MTTPRATPTALCEQIGRWCAAQAAVEIDGEPLVFVEADDSTPGNIYAGAGAMPQRSMRLTPAVSITHEAGAASGGQSGEVPLTMHALVLECRAATARIGESVLNALRECLRPEDRPLTVPANPGAGVPIEGCIGLHEDVISGGGYGWKVIEIEVVSEPRAVAIDGEQNSRAGGEAAAEMTVLVHAVSVLIEVD